MTSAGGGAALAVPLALALCLATYWASSARHDQPGPDSPYATALAAEGGHLVTRERLARVAQRMAHTVVVSHAELDAFMPPPYPYVLHVVDNPFYSTDRAVPDWLLPNPPRGGANHTPVTRWHQHSLRVTQDPNLLHAFVSDWYGGFHPKVTVTPIGFESRASHTGQEAALLEVAASLPPPRERPLRVLCTAHMKTPHHPRSGSRPHRVEMYAALKDKTYVTFVRHKMHRKALFRFHGNFSFELCPEGNGMDTHRFYESLLLRTIPVVVRNNLTGTLYEPHFPAVLVLDRWEDLTEERLRAWRDALAPRFSRAPLETRYWTDQAAAVLRRHGLPVAYR